MFNRFEICPRLIMIGEDGNHYTREEIHVINLMIFTTKCLLWKNRNEYKYEGKQSTSEKLYERIIRKVKEQVLWYTLRGSIPKEMSPLFNKILTDK